MPIRKKPITEDEFKQIISHILKIHPYTKKVNKRIFLDWKFATMLRFHYYIGLRPRELRLIEIKHINFKTRKLFIPASNEKTNHHKIMHIPERLYLHLINYLKIRCNFIHNSPFLFPSSKNPNIAQDKNYLGEKLRRILKTLNISQVTSFDVLGHKVYNKSLYSFRRGLATRTYLTTGKVEDVEAVLGHHDKMMRNAWIYVEESREEKIPEILEKVWNS